jgi:hypothetical protein
MKNKSDGITVRWAHRFSIKNLLSHARIFVQKLTSPRLIYWRYDMSFDNTQY